jgi:hypothetical protein
LTLKLKVNDLPGMMSTKALSGANAGRVEVDGVRHRRVVGQRDAYGLTLPRVG